MEDREKQDNSLPPEDSASKRDLADMSPSMRAVVNANKRKATAGKNSDIPKFDLAENIMAKQRNLTATKRKAPLQKTASLQTEVPQKKQVAIGFLEMFTSNDNKIICEIVRKDIKNLCGNFA